MPSARGARSSPFRRTAPLVAAIVLLACAVGADALRTRASAHGAATERYEDLYYLPPPDWLPTLSLGHDEALADLIWLKALIYFGVELGHGGVVEHAFDYVDAILTLDERFKRVYLWIGMAGLYHPGEVPLEDIERALAYLERGAALFPDDGELAWDLGSTLAYELAPRLTDADARAARQAQATEHMMAAARLGAGPSWLALSNATALARLGRLEQATRHLEEMHASVDDTEMRERIEHRLARLRSRTRAEALRRSMDELEARRVQDFPYLPLDLYLIVGPRGVVDEGSLLERRFLPLSSIEDSSTESSSIESPEAGD